MSVSENKAVFLCYASQADEAAHRSFYALCEAHPREKPAVQQGYTPSWRVSNWTLPETIRRRTPARVGGSIPTWAPFLKQRNRLPTGAASWRNYWPACR